jgi:hypothetical protein
MPDRDSTSFIWRLEGQLDSRLVGSSRVDPVIAEELKATIPDARVELNRLASTGTNDQQRWEVRITCEEAAQKIELERRDEIAAQLAKIELVHSERLFRNAENIFCGDVQVQRREIRVFLRPPTLRSALG